MLLKIAVKIMRENEFEQKKPGLNLILSLVLNQPSNNWAQVATIHAQHIASFRLDFH